KIPWRSHVQAEARRKTGIAIPILEAARAVAPPRAAPTASNPRHRVLIMTGIGVSTLAMAVGASTLAGAEIARKKRDELKADLPNPQYYCWQDPQFRSCQDIAYQNHRQHDMRWVAIGAFVTTGVTGVATAAYGLWARKSQSAVQVDAAVSPDGALLR